MIVVICVYVYRLSVYMTLHLGASVYEYMYIDFFRFLYGLKEGVCTCAVVCVFVFWCVYCCVCVFLCVFVYCCVY